MGGLDIMAPYDLPSQEPACYDEKTKESIRKALDMEKNKDLLTVLQGHKVYLACPYSSPYRHIEKWRVEAATYIANYLMYKGILVNSPITHGDAVFETSQRSGLSIPKDFEFWRQMCFWGVESSSIVLVMMLDGWSESTGVKEEIAHASSFEAPILYIYPELFPGFVQHMDEWSETFNKN